MYVLNLYILLGRRKKEAKNTKTDKVYTRRGWERKREKEREREREQGWIHKT